MFRKADNITFDQLREFVHIIDVEDKYHLIPHTPQSLEQCRLNLNGAVHKGSRLNTNVDHVTFLPVRVGSLTDDDLLTMTK